MRMRPQQTQQHALLVTSLSSAASCSRLTTPCRRFRLFLAGKTVLLSGVAVFCFVLAVLRRGQVRLPLDSQDHKGSMHLVELYAYNPPGERMSWSAWDEFPDDSNLMVLEDANLNSTGTIVPIGEAHTMGLLHRGIWLAVLRKGQDDGQHHEVMLLRRAPSLKTCPGAWGLCGEHSDPGEPWVETAGRAMREELLLDHAHHTLVNLLPQQSLLVRTPYTDLGRRDLQATALFAIRISHAEGNKIQPDEEVAEVKWIPIEELQNVHACNAEITDLAKLVGYYLKQHGF